MNLNGALIPLTIDGEEGRCLGCGREPVRLELLFLWPVPIGPLLMLLLGELPVIGVWLYGYWPDRWWKFRGICACCLPMVAVLRHEMIRRHDPACRL